MLNQQRSLDLIFQALADPTRRSIVDQLARGPATVGALAKPIAMSLPAVLQHIGVLEQAGLIRSEKIGRVRTCHIDAAALSEAEQWINRQRAEWHQRLDRLDQYLDTHPPKEADND